MNAIATGEFIKQLRTEAGLTQKELAEKLNCTDKAVSRWETGKGMPDVSILLELSNVLGVNVNELLIGERVPKEKAEEISNIVLVDTMKKNNKSVSKWKNRILLLLCALLLSFYYLPIMTMTPSDMMGVIFLQFIGAFLIAIIFGFTDIKFKYIYPLFSAAAYIPAFFLLYFKIEDALLYIGIFTGGGYALVFVATGIRELIKFLYLKLKK